MELGQNIEVSKSALEKVADLLLEENSSDLKLRVFVQGGGCSGFQYGFTFDEAEFDNQKNEDDFSFKMKSENHKLDVEFIVDYASMQYLQGATIDYIDDLNGSQFSIKNPNAQTTCGCGSSFSV